MILKYICIIFFQFISQIYSVTVSKSKINIPFITPNKNNPNRGVVVLDGSKNGNGELPFVEINNGDAYFYKSPEKYKENSYTKKERELENIQSESVNHFDFINRLIGNLKSRI